MKAAEVSREKRLRLTRGLLPGVSGGAAVRVTGGARCQII